MSAHQKLTPQSAQDVTAIINQPWEDVADDVTGAIERAVQPLLKTAVDSIYSGLLDATQDYLKDNLAFNIASRIDGAERQAYSDRIALAEANTLIAELKTELISTYEELIDHNGDSMDDTRAKRVAELQS